MSRTELLLGEHAVAAAPDGLTIAIRQPWYRSLPLSSVLDIEVSVDGDAIAPGDIGIRIGDSDYSLDTIGDHWESVWFIQDPAILTVPTAPHAVGDAVQVDVAIELRFPYIIIEGHGPLTRRTEASRAATVEETAR